MRIDEIIDKTLDVKTLTPKEIASMHNVDIKYIIQQLGLGIKVEKEHTNDINLAREIALDHLMELPDYYTRLNKMEHGD